MRILLVTESFAPAADAAADTARHVTDALLDAGHSVLVLTTGPGSGSYRGCRVHRTRTLFSAAAVRGEVVAFGPDVAQVLSPRAMGAAAMRALEAERVPVVTLDPTPLHPRGGAVLASSEAGARVLAAAGVRAEVWRPGVRTDEHHPGLRSADLHDRWARAASLPAPLVVAGYVGPLGLPTAKATRRLAKVAALPGVRLVAVGSGPGAPTLKEAGAKVLGPSSGLELARAIASFDLLVQPRKHHADLATVRKALASGVPPVAFRTGPASELVRDGETGVLVRPGTGGLATAVAALAADPARRETLAAAARDSVTGRTWAEAVAELVEHYPAPALAAV